MLGRHHLALVRFYVSRRINLFECKRDRGGESRLRHGHFPLGSRWEGAVGEPQNKRQIGTAFPVLMSRGA
jgi:hypothetical protein